MNEQDYSKRELDEKFLDIKEDLLVIKNVLDSVETQTKKTNGRVNGLENWRWFLVGIGTVVTVLLIPILIALIENGKLL